MWIYPARGHAGGPADFEANGAGGQRIAVVPSEDMVVVITGTGLDANDVAGLLSGIVKSDSALAENPIADAALTTRVAEAETGGSFAVAEIVPKPKPATGAIAVADVVPVPLPKPTTGVVAEPGVTLAASLAAAVLPKPRPNS
jgi:hypothetical protein